MIMHSTVANALIMHWFISTNANVNASKKVCIGKLLILMTYDYNHML